ncbi:AMP-binding protein [Pseudonocardia kujensis]|uniref:AMP-binding protein n=1 Tax=Pseudonocardia kujensis TaxID=1128675 RepID=UPI001E2BEC89|nr:AMP-binding protein [Pseudonocardia kujensis]MCE0766117.1 AMP-binding protein [Pseudonocardia kujensis]
MRATLGEEFEAALRRHRARTAVEAGGRSWTYGDLDRWSAAVADQLRAVGVRPGDAVALYLGNCVEFVVADLAVARVGAVKVPVNTLLPEATVAHIVKAARVRALVLGTGVAAVGERAGAGLPTLWVDDGGGPAAGETLAGPGDVAVPAPGIGPTDRAAIYFTGGTTGLPKGVVHTQASAVAVQYAQILEAELAQDERLLLMTPLAHAAGLFAQSALVRGATVVIEPGFDAGRALDLLRDRGVTWTFLVPTMIYRLLDLARDREDLPLRTVVYGAAPIAPSRLARALEVFGPVFVQLFGQTECPNWGTRLAKHDHDPARPELLGSCGQASIMADVRVVDDAGAPLPPGATGEVCLRAPYTLESYLGDPGATAAKFLPGGWIRTGDVGLLDEGGYLHLRDRKADMVISGGMNVYCRDVEDVLARHPAVARVAVIGVPHEDWGEAVHAVVVPRPGFSPEELLGWSRGELAGYARPKSVEVVADLPETPFGKIDKKVLRAPHWAGRDRAIG